MVTQEKTLFTYLYDIIASGDYTKFNSEWIKLRADRRLKDDEEKILQEQAIALERSMPEIENIKQAGEKLERKSPIKKSYDITDPLSSLLDFTIIEKAPFGFKPLASLFGGGDKKSPEEEAEEKVPEGNRVYVDSEEEAPKGVKVLTGKRGGLFYDMTSLTSDEHGDEITNVFNKLLDELTEAQSDEAVQQRAKDHEARKEKLEEIVENFKQQHPEAEKLSKLEAAAQARTDELLDVSLDVDPTELFDKIDTDEKLNKLHEDKFNLDRKISRDAAEKAVENDEYMELKKQVDEEQHDPTVKKLHSKLGNALIHSFKSNGFKVDDMTFNVDPDLKYEDDPARWAEHINSKVEKAIIQDVKNLQSKDWGKKMLEDNVPNYTEFDHDKDMQLALGVAHFLGAEKALIKHGTEKAKRMLGEKGMERAAHVAKIRKAHFDNSLAVYHGESNTFVASPKIWDRMTKLDDSGNLPTEMKEALKTMVHESLHSIGGNHGKHDGEGSARSNTGMDYIEDKESGLAKAGIPLQQAYNNLQQFMEEGPVELLSQCILGRKYDNDLVGKDVFKDKAFTEGAGSLENHASTSYRHLTPHLARWALAYSGGNPKKARALLGKMREVGEGKGSVDAQGEPSQSGIVANHRLMNNYTASFGQYLKDYANNEWSHEVEEGLSGEGLGFDVANGLNASQLGRGLSEGQNLKYGENQLPNISLRPEIRNQEPIFDGGGNLTQAGHSDIMHLIYGEG